jgi:hypothetical protein
VTLGTAVAVLKAEVIVPPADDGAELTGCFAADLMSDVLAFAREGSLLVTGLATAQTVRTATIKHLPGVVIVQGKETDVEMVETAREEAVALYRTPLSKYEACGLLIHSGLRPYRVSATPSARPAHGPP